MTKLSTNKYSFDNKYMICVAVIKSMMIYAVVNITQAH